MEETRGGEKGTRPSQRRWTLGKRWVQSNQTVRLENEKRGMAALAKKDIMIVIFAQRGGARLVVASLFILF